VTLSIDPKGHQESKFLRINNFPRIHSFIRINQELDCLYRTLMISSHSHSQFFSLRIVHAVYIYIVFCVCLHLRERMFYILNVNVLVNVYYLSYSYFFFLFLSYSSASFLGVCRLLFCVCFFFC
jgi:hypothetical protein